jgi:hypothetical protein
VRAQRVEPLLRDRVGDDDAGGGPAPERVLRSGELVVERIRGRHPEAAGSQRELVRRVRQRDVEGAAAREPAQGAQPRRHGADFARARRAPVCRADHLVRDPGVLQQLEGLGERPRRHRDLVPAPLEQPDQRPEERHVRRVGDVDPDAH